MSGIKTQIMYERRFVNISMWVLAVNEWNQLSNSGLLVVIQIFQIENSYGFFR